MTAVRRWGVLSGLLAPLLLVGGWTAAAALRPDAYDAARSTISELAALGAPHRWLMTYALVGVGMCHGATAAALRAAALPGRLLLALGGLATVLVAANPLPAGGGSSAAHTASAAAAFGALACWPALAWRRGPGPPPSCGSGRRWPPPRSCSPRCSGSPWSCPPGPGASGWPSAAPPACRPWAAGRRPGPAPEEARLRPRLTRAGTRPADIPLVAPNDHPLPVERRQRSFRGNKRRCGAGQAMSAAAARPAARPEKRQPPRNVPSSER